MPKFWGIPETAFTATKSYVTGGEETLKEISRKKPNLKNRIALELENKIVDLAFEQSAESVDVFNSDFHRKFS